MSLVHNRAYVGAKGYERIIDSDRFERIHAGLERLDPVQVAKRHGDRKPADDSYILRSLLHCLSCGAPMYCRRLAAGRMYQCSNVRKSTGLCSAPVIPAELLEGHVVRHLDSFVGSVERWLAERAEQRRHERDEREEALERQRQSSPTSSVSGIAPATSTGRSSRRVDRRPRLPSRSSRRSTWISPRSSGAIREAEATVAEAAGPPDVDAALEYYTKLVEHIEGRTRDTEARELNQVLTTLVAGLWAEIETDRHRLLVEFELVTQIEGTLFGEPIPPEFRHRPTLPPRDLDDKRTGTELLAEMEAARANPSLSPS